MNWENIWNWIKNNSNWFIPVVGILFCLLLLFSGDNSKSVSEFPGGGFGTFLASGLMFFLAWKFQAEEKVYGKLVTLGLILATVWAWPRIMPIVNSFGISPNLILALTIFVGIWMWQKGAGLFWWRRILFLFLIASMLGSSGGIVKRGWQEFKESTGISAPSVSLPTGVQRYTDALFGYFGYRANRQVSKLREAYITNKTVMYKRGVDGQFSITKIDFSCCSFDALIARLPSNQLGKADDK